MVAVATDFASSMRYGSVGYASAMAIDEVQAARRERLRLAAEKAGGKAALGRLLGYLDGAYVGQMIRGERPVKEDTVWKLEQKPGFQSWFKEDDRGALIPFRDLKGPEVLLITLFRRLSDERRQELLIELDGELNEPDPTTEQRFTGTERRLSDRRSATYIDERGFPSPNRRRAA